VGALREIRIGFSRNKMGRKQPTEPFIQNKQITGWASRCYSGNEEQPKNLHSTYLLVHFSNHPLAKILQA